MLRSLRGRDVAQRASYRVFSMSYVVTTRTTRLVALLAIGASGVALPQSPGRELPTLAPMIETISPAVVNISVTSNITGAPQAQDELLRRFFDFDGPPGSREREVRAQARASSSMRERLRPHEHHVIATPTRSPSRCSRTAASRRASSARMNAPISRCCKSTRKP